MSCVDLVVLVDTGTNYKVLSIKRGRPPFVGMWANPGGNIDEVEKPLDAAVRELEEETELVIDPGHFYYVGAFDKPYRDPRNKNCVSHAFVVVLDEIPVVQAGDDATECTWNDVSYDGDVTVDMAFDHAEIIKKSIQSI
jgi:8-oxo-dGTP diphosphatase